MAQFQRQNQNQQNILYSDKQATFSQGNDIAEKPVPSYAHGMILSGGIDQMICRPVDATRPFCIFSFTNSCKESKLLMGGLCEYHNKLFFNREYFNMPSGESGCFNVTAVPHQAVKYRPAFPCLSLYPSGLSDDDITADLISRNISTKCLDDVKRFVRIMTNPENCLFNDHHASSAKTYMNEVFSHYYREIAGMYDTLEKINVHVNLTKETCLKLKKNWLFDKLKSREISKEDEEVRTFFVPMTYFSIIDIIFMLGFGIESMYEPNCEIGNGYYITGSGYGCPNAASVNTSNMSLNAEYYDNIKRSLNSTLQTAMNLDPLILAAFTENPVHTKIHVVEKNDCSVNFDISRVTYTC